MGNLTRLQRLAGWAVFAIAAIVYLMTAERTGSLWDCGEFILGAQKLQVVHPPGAPLFILIGRFFAALGGMLSEDPAWIAWFVNMMSGLCTALGAAFVAWFSMRMAKLALVGHEPSAEVSDGQNSAIMMGGVVAGLATAFCTSVWFSAVEGEVYAMSFFFTCMTFWAAIRYYTTPQTNNSVAYRWLIFSVLCIALSIGVHLLSLLVLPAIAVLVFLRERDQPFLSTLGMGAGVLLGIGMLIGSESISGKVLGLALGVGGGYLLSRIKRPSLVVGSLLAALAGAALILFIQNGIIVGLPTLWLFFEIPMVNSLGLFKHVGIIPTLLIYAGLIYFAFRYAQRKNDQGIQLLTMAATVSVIAYSIIGMVVVRADAQPPVNMNSPDNVADLLPYINREQYGERSLSFGPHFEAALVDYDYGAMRYTLAEQPDGSVEYVEIGEKVSPVYDEDDMMFMPRMSDNTQNRPVLYKRWLGLPEDQPLRRAPGFGDNLRFMLSYQMGWMYWRYFMWNFSGRQNGDQGFYSWDHTRGNWISGLSFIDNARLGNQSELPDEFRNDPARNTYFLIPFLLGLIGLFWHAYKDPKGFIPLLLLFLMTGLGIIFYTNQPPNEPRERDYVLVGSFMAFSVWIGMAIPAIYSMLKDRVGNMGSGLAYGIGAIGLVAPLLMVTQNFDDHDRSQHSGARDYAHNFLQSVDQNAIIFTYGDNDTYPLWYAQEVEGIRPDVRVVNLSLIAVDWYIDLLRRKINDSPAIKLSLTEEEIRASNRNTVPRMNTRVFGVVTSQQRPRPPYPPCNSDQPITLDQLLQQIKADRSSQFQGQFDAFYESCNVYIDVDLQKARNGASGLIPPGDTNVVRRMPLRIPGTSLRDQLYKDKLAVLDIIANNMYDRPIYWAVTVQEDKMMGLGRFLQLEGLALKLTATSCQGDSGYGVIGRGCVDLDKTKNLVNNVWKWGNFDKVDTYVNDSYDAAIQSMQLVIRRTAATLVREGRTEDGLGMLDTYFEAFPNMNFPFFIQTLAMMEPYWTTGQHERIRPQMETLAQNAADRLDYYDSLSDDELKAGREENQRRAYRVLYELVNAARQSGNAELQAEIEEILRDHMWILDQGQQQLPG